MLITSRSNELIKHAVKLKDKKYRNQFNQFLVENEKILLEAIKNHYKIDTIFYLDKLTNSYDKNTDKVQVTSEVMSLISSTASNPKCVAIVHKKRADFKNLSKEKNERNDLIVSEEKSTNDDLNAFKNKSTNDDLIVSKEKNERNDLIVSEEKSTNDDLNAFKNKSTNDDFILSEYGKASDDFTDEKKVCNDLNNDKLCSSEIKINGNFLVLDRLQDPSNVGAIIRSCLGANFGSVLLIDCADIYDTKTIRSSMGAIFNIDCYKVSLEEVLNLNYPLVIMDMNGQNIFKEQFDKNQIYGFVVGNEGQGVSDKLKAKASKVVAIPMNDRLESLNASVSASIVMYAISRNLKENID